MNCYANVKKTVVRKFLNREAVNLIRTGERVKEDAFQSFRFAVAQWFKADEQLSYTEQCFAK